MRGSGVAIQLLLAQPNYEVSGLRRHREGRGASVDALGSATRITTTLLGLRSMGRLVRSRRERRYDSAIQAGRRREIDVTNSEVALPDGKCGMCGGQAYREPYPGDRLLCCSSCKKLVDECCCGTGKAGGRGA